MPDPYCTMKSSVFCSLGVTMSQLYPYNIDIEDSDVDNYKNALNRVKCDAKTLRIEIMYCTRLKFTRRFKLAFELLQNIHGVDYSAPEFQTETQDNLFLSGVYFRSHDIINYLIGLGIQDLVLLPCGTAVFEGGTALHVAILRRCPTLVRQTMGCLTEDERQTLINTHGTGEFFSSPGCCFGVPILLAMQIGCVEIFLELVKYGADVTIQHPTNGNGILHCLVVFGKQEPHKALDIYETIIQSEVMWEWYRKRHGLPCQCFCEVEKMHLAYLLLKIENADGFSPLTFAALHGVYPLLQAILQAEGVYRRTEWEMGATSISVYDMTEVDPTVRAIENLCKPSVLELLLYERPDDDIPVLAMEPIRHLMQSKWEAWKVVYILWGLWHLVSMFTYTGIVLHEYTHSDPQLNSLINATIRNTGIIHISRHIRMAIDINIGILILTYSLCSMVELGQIVCLYVKCRPRCQRYRHYKVPWSIVCKNDDFNVTRMLFTALTTVPLAGILSNSSLQPAFTALGLMFGWYFLLFFTRAFRHTSLFTVMTNRMLHLDFFRFSIIAVIHIIAFGSCLLVLLGSQIPHEFASIPEAIQTMFFVMIGIENLDFLDRESASFFAKMIATGFVVSATVLLLNLLIAAMGDTYAGVSANKEGLWLKMRVKSVLMLDRISSFSFLRKRMMGKDMQYNEGLQKWLFTVDNIHEECTGKPETLVQSFKRSSPWMWNSHPHCICPPDISIWMFRHSAIMVVTVMITVFIYGVYARMVVLMCYNYVLNNINDNNVSNTDGLRYNE